LAWLLLLMVVVVAGYCRFPTSFVFQFAPFVFFFLADDDREYFFVSEEDEAL